MRELHIDCSMGCAGDMLTGALLELHPDKENFIKKINAALGGRVVVSAAPDAKCGVRGTHVTMLINGEEEHVCDDVQSEHRDAHMYAHEHEHVDVNAHAHNHEHEHANADVHVHSHTSISEIKDFINQVNVSDAVKADALAVYKLIAEAESIAHGCPIENVHFHEVGSLDALADVLSVCMLMHELAPDRILASHINVGSGYVKCAHGILPVPAPATEHILRAVPTYSGEIVGELCTPTGAALLKHFVEEFADASESMFAIPDTSCNFFNSENAQFRCDTETSLKINVGCGTGTKDFAVPNVVKVVLNEI